MRRILIVAAHPDDETLGMGGTIAKLAKADEVALCFMGTGVGARADGLPDPDEALARMAAADAAAQQLGVPHVVWLPVDPVPPDNQFDAWPLLRLVKPMEAVIRQVDPRIVYTHHPGDLNVDHRRTFQAVLTATRPVPGCGVLDLLTFEVPSSSEWSFDTQVRFSPNVFVDVAETLYAKMAALECYGAEMREFPHPRSAQAIRARALYWGSVAGCHAAEAFQLIRSLRS